MLRRCWLFCVAAAIACGPSSDAPLERADYAYVADGEESGELWVGDIEGNHRRIDHARLSAWDPIAWSLDDRIASVTIVDIPDLRITVTDDTKSEVVAEFTPAQLFPDAVFAVSWSPDGEPLVVVVAGVSPLSHDGTVVSYELVDLRLPMSERGQHIGEYGDEVAVAPSWTPDGGSVIGVGWVWGVEPPAAHGLFLHDVAQGAYRTPALGQDPSVLIPPPWSPAGTQIAFSSDRAGTLDVFVADDLDSEPRLLFESDCDETEPRWIGDGSRLLVRHHCAGPLLDDLVVDATSGEVLDVIQGLGAWAMPSPDGSILLWTENDGGHDEVVLYDLVNGVEVGRVRGRGAVWKPTPTRL